MTNKVWAICLRQPALAVLADLSPTSGLGHSAGIPSAGEIGMYLRQGYGEFVRQMPQGTRVQPEEIWVPALALWVRADGSCIHISHREPNGGYYYPGRFARWRLRRAANEFRRLVDATDELCERLGLIAQTPATPSTTPATSEEKQL